MPGVRRYTNDPSITHLCGRVDSTGSQGWYFPGGTGSSCVGIELFIFPFSLWRGRYRFWVDAGWNATAGSAFQLRAVRTDGHVYNSQTHVLGTDTASSYRTTSVEFNIPDDCASMRLQLLVLVSSPGGFFTAETGLDRIP